MDDDGLRWIVSYLYGVQVVAGSNPAVPTNLFKHLAFYLIDPFFPRPKIVTLVSR